MKRASSIFDIDTKSEKISCSFCFGPVGKRCLSAQARYPSTVKSERLSQLCQTSLTHCPLSRVQVTQAFPLEPHEQTLDLERASQILPAGMPDIARTDPNSEPRTNGKPLVYPHLSCGLLGTLPDIRKLLGHSLSNSAPDGVITMELAKGSILNEEIRRKSQGSSLQSDVLVTERQGRSKSRGPSNRGNHHSSSSKGKFVDVECYHCHKKGHTMKFLQTVEKGNKKKKTISEEKHKENDEG
ncbi:hypothetical protein Tco_0485462 [Tanacetum coccineum]